MDLKDICTIETGIRGPAQLAVKLAKYAARDENPVKDCVVIYFDELGWPGIMFTSMDVEELAELERFFRMVGDEIHKELWREALNLGDED